MPILNSSVQYVSLGAAFCLSVIVSIVFTYIVRAYARKKGIVDAPDGERKRHARPVALLGGLAIAGAVWCVIGFFIVLYPESILGKVSPGKIAAVFAASLALVVLGMVDEKYALSPRLRFIITVCIATIPIFGGIGLDGITNPFGNGTIGLDKPSFTIPLLHTTLMLGDAVVFVWLLGMMYTTKLLDGLDGLSTGIAAIGGSMIFLLTQTTRFFQPDVGLLSLIFTGACIGFLVFNAKPASIFLGESGSLFLGFFLGILAVISGGKIATTLLVMALPVLDVVRVIVVRMARGQNITQGDREHVHYRLLELGLSERGVVVVFYLVALFFGATTFFLPSSGKIIALAAAFFGMLFFSIFLYRRSRVIL